MKNQLDLTPAQNAGAIIESVITKGDLGRLTPEERVAYYRNVCQSVGLNPLTRPFEYLVLNGKMVLYARRDAADQLRKLNSISIEVVSRKIEDGLCVVHVRARDKTGRADEDFGTVSVAGLRGEQLANAQLKAVTKAKRRVTLSIAGLGFLDETETVEDDLPVIADTSSDLDQFASDTSDSVIEGTSDIIAAATAAADRGTQEFRAFWRGLSSVNRELLKPRLSIFEDVAKVADFGLPPHPYGLPPLEPAAAPPRSTIWQEPSYRVEPKNLLSGEPDWQQWAFDVGFLAQEATKSERDKLKADNADHLRSLRRADGTAHRTLVAHLDKEDPP